MEDGIILTGTCIVIPHKNVKLYLTLFMKDTWVLISVSCEPRILFIGQA